MWRVVGIYVITLVNGIPEPQPNDNTLEINGRDGRMLMTDILRLQTTL